MTALPTTPEATADVVQRWLAGELDDEDPTLARLVQRAADRLSRSERALLAARYALDLTLADLAERTGVSECVVENRVATVLGRLAGLVASYAYQESA